MSPIPHCTSLMRGARAGSAHRDAFLFILAALAMLVGLLGLAPTVHADHGLSIDRAVVDTVATSSTLNVIGHRQGNGQVTIEVLDRNDIPRITSVATETGEGNNVGYEDAIDVTALLTEGELGACTVRVTQTRPNRGPITQATTGDRTNCDPPQNTPPVANDDAYSTNQDTTLTVAAPGVLTNDGDADNDPLTASLGTGPSEGTVTLNTDGSFTYIPNETFFGTDSFTYVANDGQADSNIAMVTITVNQVGVNNPPVAIDQTFPIDTAVLDRAGLDGIPNNAEVPAPGVLLGATDPDGDDLTAILMNAENAGGVVNLSPDGSFTYEPAAGSTGGTFTYVANDNDLDSGIQTVTLTVATGLVVNPGKNRFNIMMNYELGMHCTGFEFAYCCVLPPYNSIITQVARSDKGQNDSDFPMMLEGDPVENLDALGRETVLREPQLDGNDNFQKYVLRYWHEAQPRNDGRGKAQSSVLISAVEGNSMFMWNTVYDAADTDEGNNLVTGTYEGSTDVVLGDGDYLDANDNYGSGWMNHFYIYEDLEGTNTAETSAEVNKIRLGLENLNASTPLSLVIPDDCGPAFHPMGPDTQGGDPNNPVVANTCGGVASRGNLLTWSTDHGTVVFTQMKVLENLPVMLTSPRIWEALGLPLTPFEDTIDFFGDPGLVDEDSIRPYVQMKAQLHNYNPNAPDGVGAAVMDAGNPVIGFGTAPIDIPNCERCHSELNIESENSAQQIGVGGRNNAVAQDVVDEIAFWMNFYGLSEAAGDSTWYPRLKGAAISILAIHDQEHGTGFTDCYQALPDDPNCPVTPTTGFPQNTRLGKEAVICQKCHADNVIAVVKSAKCGLDNEEGLEPCATGALIPPITEAIHDNHRNVSDGGVIMFADSEGRDGGCQGCHPAHRSDGDMEGYPITLQGNNFYADRDNRDANGGCFVGRDVHSNPGKDVDGAETPPHLNAVGQYLADNVFSNDATGPENAGKGIWCTNCHTQLSQEIWRAENMVDLVHGVPGKEANLTTDAVNIRALPTLTDVALAVGLATNPLCELSEGEFADPTDCAIAMLDPKADNPIGDLTHAIWRPDVPDANVAIVEVTGTGGCNTALGFEPVLDPTFNVDVCAQVDVDGDPSYRILEGFCTTPDCVTLAQATLTGEGNGGTAVAVPFSAAADSRDHWLSPGEPHCADCHAAPYTEQSGNINAFPPFNYPRKASLMRYSRGHQDISCQGCHESIHGLYPVTPTIDTTSYAQAANLNSDGSHGPVKCGACHESGTDQIPNWLNNSVFGINNFDDAATWGHTYTDEASVLNSTCQNCHGVNGDEDEAPDFNSTPADWDDVRQNNEDYLEHAMDDEDKDLPRGMMDKAEIEVSGAVFSSTDGSDGVCLGCHGNESREVAECDTEWKQHLTEGRVAQSTWEKVSAHHGVTCGW